MVYCDKPDLITPYHSPVTGILLLPVVKGGGRGGVGGGEGVSSGRAEVGRVVQVGMEVGR